MKMNFVPGAKMKNPVVENEQRKYRYIIIPQLGISMVHDGELDQLKLALGSSEMYELRLVNPKPEKATDE